MLQGHQPASLLALLCYAAITIWSSFHWHRRIIMLPAKLSCSVGTLMLLFFSSSLRKEKQIQGRVCIPVALSTPS